MKEGIHPKMFLDAVTNCVSCGTSYKIPSTVQKQQVEVCSHCHPVYTGEYRGVISSGRVDRFRKVTEAAKKKQAERKEVEEKRKAKPAKKKGKK